MFICCTTTYVLGTEQQRAVDSWIIVRNGSLWSNLVFEKEVISYSNIKICQAWSLFCIGIWEHTNLYNKGIFFFHYSLATSMTHWVQIFTDSLWYLLCSWLWQLCMHLSTIANPYKVLYNWVSEFITWSITYFLLKCIY